ncbi:MAG TPA: PEP-CTERM sorting domain-containing protein [Longimicrobiaceae bacterium]|nr:PEP-CTERM sorting domain-containing protein [Longimicrobiaceae bacterium]
MVHFISKRFRGLTSGLACLALLAVTASTANAQGAYVSTERFGYTGTIERYNSLSDLQAGINAVSGSPFSVPARDLSLYMVDGNAAFDGAANANASMFLSFWYANGGDSPSNQNTGFVQMYDTEGGSVTSMSGSWANTSKTIFQWAVSGGNMAYGCTPPADCGRLWNAGSSLGSAETTAGSFYSYFLDFTATGLAAATWNPTTGVYESISDPTGVTGSLTGIFQNQSIKDPSSNGWYKYDLALTMDSWAYDNGYAAPSAFGSAHVTPEPASMILLGSGLAGVVGARRRRRKQSS